MLYEFDTKVPLVVVGPGVARRVVTANPALNIDFVPTFLDIAGAPIPDYIDGESFLPLLSGGQGKQTQQPYSRQFLIEYKAATMGSSPADKVCTSDRNVSHCHAPLHCFCNESRNNTYNCIRTLVEGGRNDVFCQMEDSENFKEYYDLTHDPYQLSNRAKDLTKGQINWFLEKIHNYKTCVGIECNRLSSVQVLGV